MNDPPAVVGIVAPVATIAGPSSSATNTRSSKPSVKKARNASSALMSLKPYPQPMPPARPKLPPYVQGFEPGALTTFKSARLLGDTRWICCSSADCWNEFGAGVVTPSVGSAYATGRSAIRSGSPFDRKSIVRVSDVDANVGGCTPAGGKASTRTWMLPPVTHDDGNGKLNDRCDGNSRASTSGEKDELDDSAMTLTRVLGLPVGSSGSSGEPGKSFPVASKPCSRARTPGNSPKSNRLSTPEATNARASVGLPATSGTLLSGLRAVELSMWMFAAKNCVACVVSIPVTASACRARM